MDVKIRVWHLITQIPCFNDGVMRVMTKRVILRGIRTNYIVFIEIRGGNRDKQKIHFFTLLYGGLSAPLK